MQRFAFLLHTPAAWTRGMALPTLRPHRATTTQLTAPLLRLPLLRLPLLRPPLLRLPLVRPSQEIAIGPKAMTMVKRPMTTTNCVPRRGALAGRAPPMLRSRTSARPVSRPVDWSSPANGIRVSGYTAAWIAAAMAFHDSLSKRPKSLPIPFAIVGGIKCGARLRKRASMLGLCANDPCPLAWQYGHRSHCVRYAILRTRRFHRCACSC